MTVRRGAITNLRMSDPDGFRFLASNGCRAFRITKAYDDLVDLLTSIEFIELMAEEGLTAELLGEMRTAADALPSQHDAKKILRAIADALRHDLEFIGQFPKSIFQSIWNRCWWGTQSEDTLSTSSAATTLVRRQLETWREQKNDQADFVWIRSLLPLRNSSSRQSQSIAAFPRVKSGRDTKLAISNDGKYVVTNELHDERVETIIVRHPGTLRPRFELNVTFPADGNPFPQNVSFRSLRFAEDSQTLWAVVTDASMNWLPQDCDWWVCQWHLSTREHACTKVANSRHFRYADLSADCRAAVFWTHLNSKLSIAVFDLNVHEWVHSHEDSFKRYPQRAICRISAEREDNSRIIVVGNSDEIAWLNTLQNGPSIRVQQMASARINANTRSRRIHHDIALFADGERVAQVLPDGKIRIVNFLTNTSLRCEPAGKLDVGCLSVSSDDKWLVAGETPAPLSGSPGAKLLVYETGTGRLIGQIPGHTGAIDTIQLVPQEMLAISVSPIDRTIRLSEVGRTSLPEQVKNIGRIKQVSFKSNDLLVVKSQKGAAKRWRLNRDSNGKVVDISRGTAIWATRSWLGTNLTAPDDSQHQPIPLAYHESNDRLEVGLGTNGPRFAQIKLEPLSLMVVGEQHAVLDSTRRVYARAIDAHLFVLNVEDQELLEKANALRTDITYDKLASIEADLSKHVTCLLSDFGSLNTKEERVAMYTSHLRTHIKAIVRYRFMLSLVMGEMHGYESLQDFRPGQLPPPFPECIFYATDDDEIDRAWSLAAGERRKLIDDNAIFIAWILDVVVESQGLTIPPEAVRFEDICLAAKYAHLQTNGLALPRILETLAYE